MVLLEGLTNPTDEPSASSGYRMPLTLYTEVKKWLARMQQEEEGVWPVFLNKYSRIYLQAHQGKTEVLESQDPDETTSLLLALTLDLMQQGNREGYVSSLSMEDLSQWRSQQPWKHKHQGKKKAPAQSGKE